MAVLVLAGCGAASQDEPQMPEADIAKAALHRIKAPPDFRLATCKFLKTEAYTRCYRRAGFVPLNPATLAAFITASGLTPASSTVSCPRYIRARSDATHTRDYCDARARAASVEFAAFATSIRFRKAAIKPSERKIAAELRGTVFELAVVATDA